MTERSKSYYTQQATNNTQQMNNENDKNSNCTIHNVEFYIGTNQYCTGNKQPDCKKLNLKTTQHQTFILLEWMPRLIFSLFAWVFLEGSHR